MSNELQGSALINELKREANDTIRVHNPLTGAFTVRWDKANSNIKWEIPGCNSNKYGVGKGNRDVPRYIAIKFITEIVTEKLNRLGKDKWEKYKKDNFKMGDYTAKEEERIMLPFYKDEEKIAKMMDDSWLGIVQRNGDDFNEPEEEKKAARGTVQERLMANLADKELILENKDKLVEELK